MLFTKEAHPFRFPLWGALAFMLFIYLLLALPVQGQKLDTSLLKNMKARSIGAAGMSG